MDPTTYAREIASMEAGEQIEERYSKEIAAWAYTHDRDAQDMTPEMRARKRVWVRALRAGLDLRYALAADFASRLYRNGRLTDWPVRP